MTLIPTSTLPRTGVSAGGANLGSSVSVTKKPVLPVQVAGLVPLYECDSTECRVPFDPNCCFYLPVFGNIQPGKGGAPTADINSNYKNDWSFFYVDYALYGANPTALGTWTIQKCEKNPDAVKEGSKYWINSIQITDQSWGVYFPLGSISNHKTYTSIWVNWGKVLKARGAGRYRVKFNTSFNGVTTCQVSDDFVLKQFDCTLADSTVKWEIVLPNLIGSHNIQGKLFDLCDLKAPDSVRMFGFFGKEKKYEYLKVYQEYQNGTVNQIRNEALQEWEFTSKLWPKEYLDRLSVYMMMAKTRKVSDYNINNSDYNIKQLLVVPEGSWEPEYHEKDHNRKQNLPAKFRSGQQSIIASDCCITSPKR